MNHLPPPPASAHMDILTRAEHACHTSPFFFRFLLMGHDKFTSTSFTWCGGKEAANVEILS